MTRRRPVTFVLFALGVLALASIVGCPFEFENEPRSNTPPTTFFLGDPPDTTFRNEIFFNWSASDLDTDVVAYQFQLVQTDQEYYFTGGAGGTLLAAIDPRQGEPGELWSGRELDAFRSFSDLDDGYYELRVRAIDAKGIEDPSPARHRFYVFYDDVIPVPIFVVPTDPSTRLTQTSEIRFELTASDESRNASTPLQLLEHSYQLRAATVTNCATHLNDQFTAWTRFTVTTPVIEVGVQPPTVYTDLTSCNCEWIFTYRVRDPAGNVGTGTHTITKICPGG